MAKVVSRFSDDESDGGESVASGDGTGIESGESDCEDCARARAYTTTSEEFVVHIDG